MFPARLLFTSDAHRAGRVRTIGMVVAACMVLVLLSGLVVTALTNTAHAQQGEQERLSAAREELAAIGDRIATAEQQQESADRALEDADTTLLEIERILNEVASSVERQRASVRDAERRLAVVQDEADTLQDAFAARIARLYMQGPELTIELLLSSDDADEAIARTVLLERLTEGDQVDLERLESARVAVTAEGDRLIAEQFELEARRDEQEVIREDAEALRSERALSAADARARTDRLLAEQDDLEVEEERLGALIRTQQETERRAASEREAAAERQTAAAARDRAPSGGGSSGGGAVASGGYAWPMCAPVTSEYGPRWGRVHRGIDQGASTGTPIGAARAGRVIFAGWQGGYGNLTLIDHGDAVTAYAHQSSLAVGQGAQVSRGQTIGYVGSTGNSTGPHLHLEIRVNGSAVNPRQYLSGSPC